LSTTIAEYLVAKIPTNRVDLLLECHKKGYYLVETNFCLKKSLTTLELPARFLEYKNKINYRLASVEDVKKILHEVKTGLFFTDKIALDPKFGLQKSANRYQNWIYNEIKEQKSSAIITTIGCTDIGFAVIRNVDDEETNALFIALFADEKMSGLGFATIYSSLCFAKQEGYKSIITGVSSNNIASLKTHLNMGYSIDKISYVLVKHSQ